MPTATIEERLACLEEKVARLTGDQPVVNPSSEPWWKRHSGAFKDDPLYDEAMRLGAEYRKSQPTAADSPDEFAD